MTQQNRMKNMNMVFLIGNSNKEPLLTKGQTLREWTLRE